PFLRWMFGFQVVPHREAAREEHRGQLGGRFADLRVERLRLFHDQDLELRLLAAQKDGRRGAAECPSENDDVVSLHDSDASMRAACKRPCTISSPSGCSSSSTGDTWASS